MAFRAGSVGPSAPAQQRVRYVRPELRLLERHTHRSGRDTVDHGRRGLNENTNGLIRDFFPKGTDFSTIANAEVAKVERLLNARPRKSLGFRSPQEVFDSLAHS